MDFRDFRNIKVYSGQNISEYTRTPEYIKCLFQTRKVHAFKQNKANEVPPFLMLFASQDKQ